LKPEHVRKRKDWCKNVGSWPDEEWKKVIWTDESSIELGLSSRKVKVWRKEGERYKVNCLAPNKRSERISVMFWGCFWQDELGPLVALPKGRIDSGKYGEILEEHVSPSIWQFKRYLETNLGSWRTTAEFTHPQQARR
jgi:hypothetical protein